MRNTLETRLGLFVALALITAFIILEMVGGTRFFKRGYRVSALFNSVQELTVGSPVKMAGVPIGRVENVGFKDSKVEVAMKIDRGYVVKTDSKASIRFTGLMGQNFVAIDFGSENAPRVEDGQTIASVEQPDFNALMARLDEAATGIQNITKTFTGDKPDNLIGPLMNFIKDNREPLTATIANFKSVSDQIAQGKGTVGKLIHDDALYTAALTTVSNVTQTVTQTGDEARQTLADARKIVARVNAGEGTVGRLLADDALYREATNSMTNLREILQKVNNGQGTAAKIINDPALYKNANMTLQKVDKATESLEDQGVLSVVGIAVGRLF